MTELLHNWWQFAVLMLLGTAALSWLLLLRARLAIPSAGAAHGAPVEPSTLAEGLAELASVRAEWRTVKKELDAYFEALDDQVNIVERKRRRIAASESRERAQQEQTPNGVAAQPVDARLALVHRARAAGHPV